MAQSKHSFWVKIKETSKTKKYRPERQEALHVFHVWEAEDIVDVQLEEIGNPFCGGGLTEEGLLALVLTVLNDKVANIVCDERVLSSL